MIAVVPYTNMDGKSPRNPQTGMSRLIEDLSFQADERVTTPPESLKERLMRKIEEEPARVQTDLCGRIVSINPAFSQLCGYQFQEIKGRKPGTFLQGEGTDPLAVKTLRKAIAARKPVDVTITNYHKDGSPYQVWISITPRFDEAGEVIGFLAIERKV
jgi:PAS domain S-box-containing protein